MTARRLLTAYVALVVAIAAIGPAAAEPPAGPYFGTALSWTTVPTDVTETEFLAPPPPIFEDGDFDAEGLGGTLLIGYRAKLSGKLLAGVEFDATFFDLEESYSDYQYQSDWLLTLRGVLGFQATDALLLQGTFGVAWLDIAASEGGSEAASDTIAGWVIGLSAEHNLTKIGSADVALRGDYLYANFEGFNYETTVAPVAPVVGEFVETDSEMHQLRLGVVIRPN